MEKRPKGLGDLPNELLHEILSNIPRQSQLAKVALVSEHFKTLVEPLLYRDIVVSVCETAEERANRKMVDGRMDSTVPSFESFDQLIHVLSKHQHLSNGVLTLCLRTEVLLWDQFCAAHSRLLKQLPQLRALSFSPPPLNLSIPDVNCALTSLRLDFSEIGTHYCGLNGRGSYAIPLVMVAKQLWIPGLCKLQLDDARYISEEDSSLYSLYFPKEKLGTSTITDLRLLKSAFLKYDDFLAEFLRSIKCLKRFVVEIHSVISRVYRGPGSGVFEHGLSQHRDTIEELAVAVSQQPYLRNWALGTFTQWSSLRRLAVPSYMIPSTANLHEILPPLLEAFQIEHFVAHVHPAKLNNDFHIAPGNPKYYNSRTRMTQEDNLANLHRLADSKGSLMPQLKHVVWWFQAPTEYRSDDPILLDLASAFQETRIKFELVSEWDFKDTPFGKRLCEWPR
ncbi:MAG: hypothetical protein Q9161_000211 [Pseudevernia consocians]